MEAHSPQWTGIRQVAASGGENLTAASFWYWAKEHGWARTIDTTAVQVPSSQPQRPTPEIVDDLVPATKAMPTRASEPEGGIPLDSKNSDYLTAALGEVFQLKDTQWICVDGVLHQWRDTHYEAVPDDELTPQIADYLSRLYYHDKTEIIHHWAKPKFVNEVLSWFRQRLGNTPANPQNSINCRNGVITWDWNDRDELRIDFSEHSPSFPFTYVTDFDYDPNANPEHMWKLLAAVEPDDLDTMQRILGSSLDLRRYRAVRGRPRAARTPFAPPCATPWVPATSHPAHSLISGSTTRAASFPSRHCAMLPSTGHQRTVNLFTSMACRRSKVPFLVRSWRGR
jgi:hypothetical protein